MARSSSAPSGPQAKRRNHQARVTEHRLRLQQALAFHAADQPVGVHVDIVERQRCRVAETNTMLVFRLVVGKARRAFFYDEPGRTAGRVGQNGVSISNAAVADPLLAAIDLVADNLAVLDDAVGRGLQRSQIAAGFRFGGAVGEQNSLFRDSCPATFSSAPEWRRRLSDRCPGKWQTKRWRRPGRSAPFLRRCR